MTIDDEYRDLVPLGDPPGSALAAVQAGSGAAWALKVLPGRLDRRTRGEVEAELRRLAGPASTAPIVAADEIVELPDGRTALRRELCAQSLPELIESFGPLSVPDTIALGGALAEALAAAGVGHGGVTPGNVLFRESGEPVLTDFGVAVRRAWPPEHDAGFRAPETIRDAVLDARADRYGLGAILHLALAGTPPFPARPGEPEGDHLLRVLTEPPPAIDRDDLPPWLGQLVRELLDKDPDRRPADVTARLAGPDLGGPRPAGAPIIEFGPERPRRLTRPPMLVAAVALLLAVAAVLVTLNRPKDMDVPPAPPAAAASSAAPAAPAASGPAVTLELADPVDHGDVVTLRWTSSVAGLDYGIGVAPAGGETDVRIVGRVTTTDVPVERGRGYCFEVRATNSANPVVSAPKAIRGAVCHQ
jgi:eukaryotic-like serine/threonine-protein kinase